MTEEYDLFYDPVEAVLEAMAPFVGLVLSKRYTGEEIKVLAEGDKSLNPDVPDSLDEIVQAKLQGEEIDLTSLTMEQVEYCGDYGPDLLRIAKFFYMNTEYLLKLKYFFSGDLDHPTNEQVNRMVQMGTCSYGLYLYEVNESSRSREGPLMFYVGIERETKITFHDEVNNNEGEIIDSHYTTQTTDTISDMLFSEDGERFLATSPLGLNLKNLLERYNIGSRVDPVKFTIDFIQTIADNS